MSEHSFQREAVPFDELIQRIADYAASEPKFSNEAYQTARWCLLDSLGCGLLALQYPACTKMLGPVVPDVTLEKGARVPGTNFVLDPVQAAFNIGTMIRWLDYNDTWLAAEWGHPSDNFGAILGLLDYLDRNPSNPWRPNQAWTIQDVLQSAIKAYEIQGILALENSFNRIGLDHVLLVRIASTAVATSLLGGTREQIADAVSNAWIDGGALRTYRHAPNTGSRKSWAAGDATRRAVQIALWTMAGEMGYSTAMTASRWGFHDAVLHGKPVVLARDLGCYVMENILFKVSFPAEFHAQTAAEAGMKLHAEALHRLDDIVEVRIETQESAVRIIDKKGPLYNPADRDHCIQYITAIALLYGDLNSDHYLDQTASDSRIDTLRSMMVVVEKESYSKDYLDSEKRSIANSVQLFYRDGTASQRIEVEYPLGHRRRRAEAIPELQAKFRRSTNHLLPSGVVDSMVACFDVERSEMANMRVNEWISLTLPERA